MNLAQNDGRDDFVADIGFSNAAYLREDFDSGLDVVTRPKADFRFFEAHCVCIGKTRLSRLNPEQEAKKNGKRSALTVTIKLGPGMQEFVRKQQQKEMERRATHRAAP